MHGYWMGSNHKGHKPLFQNVIFESNQTKYASSNYNKRGGAVYVYYGSAAYFRDVTFKYNNTDYRGGAVSVSSGDTTATITFERTNFIGNYTAPIVDGASAHGGAVSLQNTGKAVFESSTFDSNAVKINGSCCSNEGGAIYSQNNYDSLIVRNSRFNYNKVYMPSGNDGGDAEGGAMYITSGYGDVVVTNSLFLGNTAESEKYNYSSGSDDRDAYGGAIRIELNRWSSGNNYLFPYKSVFINNTFVS